MSDKTDTVEKIDDSNKKNDETEEIEKQKNEEDSIMFENKESDYKKYIVRKPYLDNELGRVVSEDEKLSLTENRAKEIIEKLPGYIELIIE